MPARRPPDPRARRAAPAGRTRPRRRASTGVGGATRTWASGRAFPRCRREPPAPPSRARSGRRPAGRAARRRRDPVHGAFGEQSSQRSTADRGDRLVECSLVALSAPDRDLPVEPERPAEPELAEELGRHQEPGHPPSPRARHQAEQHAVECRDVVARHDRRTGLRDVRDPLDADPERRPPGQPDDGQAEPPPSVQVAATRHARMLLAAAAGVGTRVGGPVPDARPYTPRT